MKNKNIIKLFAFLWSALLIVSCSNEDLDRKDSPTVPEGLPVTMKLNIGTPGVTVVETKALENEDNTFGMITNLAVLVYDEKGENPMVTYHDDIVPGTSVKGLTFDAKTGKRKIYVLANIGSKSEAEKYATEKNLLEEKIESRTPTGEEIMLGCVVKGSGDNAMMNSSALYDELAKKTGNGVVPIEIDSDGDFSARVIPPYSKITFKIEKELPENVRVYLAIKGVNVRTLPVKYGFLPQKWTLEDGVQNNSVPLYKNENAKPNDEVEDFARGFNFYMYENLQGENNKDNKDPRLKTPVGLTPPTGKGHNPSLSEFKNWYAEWNKVPCTYIEVIGHYTIFTPEGNVNHVGDGQINYRFFLGENSMYDFNIKRNTHYNVTLTFKGLAGKDELDYEWRVFADLENATFYPKGELVIDGAPAKIGIVPFYVVNASSSSVMMSTDNLPYADMQIYHEVDFGGGPYYINASTALTNVKMNDYNKFGVATNNLGILNSFGHTDVKNGNSYVFYKSDGTTQTNFSSNDNYTLREDVGLGKIYRTRDFSLSIGNTLEIKEYPLLYLGNEKTLLDENGKNAYYARRLDGASYGTSFSYQDFETITGKVNSMEQAKTYCRHGEYSGTGAMFSYLPSQADIKQIIKYEKAFPLKNDSYWTTDGLINGITGEFMSTSRSGYIRCIYKNNGL